MTKSETRRKLIEWGVDLSQYHTALITAFYEEMANKHYGTEETANAWGFFRAGWQAAHARVGAQPL